MGKGSGYTQLDRQDQLLGLLKSADSFRIDDLAIELAVSRRTILRDLDRLRHRGHPIEADAGRGGGVRLYKHWGIGRVQLSHQEVIDLLLSIAIMEKLKSPIFLTHLGGVKNKLFASFPVDQQNRLKKLRARILIGDLASATVMGSYSIIKSNLITQLISAAFFEQKIIEIEYSDENKKLSKRIIEPQYFFLNWPVWYLLAWDRTKNAARCFRLDRVKRVVIAADTFHLKKATQLMDEVDHYARKI